MPITTLELQKVRSIVDRSSYIKMAIQLGRSSVSPYSAYSISPGVLLSDFGIKREELHNELSALVRNKSIQGTLPNFVVTWSDPSILTSYNPAQVIQLRGSGMFRAKGYLFFCLGADNPQKNKQQIVDPVRLTQFYKLGMADFFKELGQLVAEKSLTTDINQITIQWLVYSSSSLQVTPDETIASILEDMRQRIAALSDSVSTVDYITTQELDTAIASLQELMANQAVLPPTQVAELLNNWARFNQIYPTAGFYRTIDTEVQLVGLVKGTALNTVMFRLPAGYRPVIAKLFSVWTGATPGTVQQLGCVRVEAEGNVVLMTGNLNCVSLENIRFRCS